MKIAVLGAGAMGSLYGGLLRRAGNEVTLIDVNKEHIRAINEQGLNIESEEGVLNIKVQAAQAGDVREVPELLILFTKTIYSQSALESVRHLLSPDTWVLSLQNGLGNDELISRFVQRDHIIVGTTDFPSGFTKPGWVSMKGRGTTKMMSANGQRHPFLDRVRQVMNEAGFNCLITEDVFVSIWEKVAFNSAMNAIAAVTRLKLGDLSSVEEGRELAFAVAREVVNTANLKGVEADGQRVLSLMEKDFREHANHRPSMLQDVLAHRMTEVDFINGAVVREAEKLGSRVPVTKTMFQLVKTIQSNYENLLN